MMNRSPGAHFRRGSDRWHDKTPGAQRSLTCSSFGGKTPQRLWGQSFEIQDYCDRARPVICRGIADARGLGKRNPVAATDAALKQASLGWVVANQIINVAIHDLEKGADGFRVRVGNDHLAVTPTTQRVVDELYELYSRRASKSHGKFSTADDAAPTEKHLRDYIDKKSDFADLTEKMMATLKHQAGLRNAAQGGHVFFAHFDRDGRHFMLVAILNDKLSAALTSSYDVADVRHLDMDGFRFAGRINLTGWAASEERYIGFLKGKGSVSEYFMEFLGCDNSVQVRQDTTDLVQALKGYADSQGLVGEARDDFLGKAKAICDRAARNRDEIEFEALANELTPKEPQALLAVLTDPDRKLNDRFVPDRRALNSLVKFKAKTAQWSVEFEREALSGGKVRYDASENTLTLLDLPADLTAQLRNELADDA